MKTTQDLKRALLISMALVLGLGALAFWPSSHEPEPRPGLKAPIVFDELLSAPAAPADSSSTPPR